MLIMLTKHKVETESRLNLQRTMPEIKKRCSKECQEVLCNAPCKVMCVSKHKILVIGAKLYCQGTICEENKAKPLWKQCGSPSIGE